MTFPLVRDLAADKMPVAVTCRVLGFSRHAFCAWHRDPVSDRDVADAYLSNAALDVHDDDPEFGYRFVTDVLAAAGHVASERRVWRLCSQARTFSAHSRKRGWRSGLVRRSTTTSSSVTSPRRSRTGCGAPTSPSTTPTRGGEGMLYLCATRDVCSARIVGYSTDSRMKTRVAVNAVSSAVARRRGATAVIGCTVHSDGGSQFGSRRFVEELKHRGCPIFSF